MRILMLEPGPDFSVMDCHVGWKAAFIEHGCQVASVNLNDRLEFYTQAALCRDGRWTQAFSSEAGVWMAARGIIADVFEFVPDVVFITSCFFVPVGILDLFRSRGIKVVLLHTESPYEDDTQIERAQHADINLVNDPIHLDQYPTGTLYQPHCYNPAVHWPRPPRPDYKSDVAFVGTAFQSRIEFLEQVDWSGIDVLFGGNWNRLKEGSPLLPYVGHALDECLDNDQTVDVYSSTKASFNLYRVESEREGLEHGWACGPREIELAATGTWFARSARPESDELFPMLPTFDTPAELGDILRWALANDDVRETAACAARAAIADRTFKNAVSRLLSLLTK